MANIEVKKFHTRVQLKYDLWENWNTETAKAQVPLKGEVCLVEVPKTAASGIKQDVPPSVLMKVGDGTTTFGELPWLSALAADVHSWAKMSETDFKAWLVSEAGPNLATKSELGVLEGTVNGIDDRLEVVEAALGVPADYDVAENGTAFDRLDDLETALGMGNTGEGSISSRVGALETSMETVLGDKDTVGSIAEAKAQADKGVSDAAAAQGTANDALNKVNKLIGEDANKTAREIAAEEIAAQLIPEAAKESLNTLEEIAAWIQSHPDDASAMNADILDVRKEVYGTEDGKVSADGKSRIDVLVEGLAAGIGTRESEISRVEALITGAGTGSVSEQIGAAKTELKGTADDKADAETIAGAKKYAEEKAGAAESNAKGYADGLNNALAGRVTAVEGKLEGIDSVSGAIADAKDAAIEAAGTAADEKDNAVKSALIGKSTDAITADTIFGAKNYADNVVSAEAGRVDALIGTLPTGQTTVVGAIDAAQDAAEKHADDAVAGLLGKDTDTKESNTVIGAKKYADDVASTAKDDAIEAAEDYTDVEIGKVNKAMDDLKERPFVAVETNGVQENGDIHYVTFYCGSATEMF